MAEVINLDTLELPDCEHCNHPSKRVYAKTMDLEGPGIPGVLYHCENRKCRRKWDAIGSFILRTLTGEDT